MVNLSAPQWPSLVSSDSTRHASHTTPRSVVHASFVANHIKSWWLAIHTVQWAELSPFGVDGKGPSIMEDELKQASWQSNKYESGLFACSSNCCCLHQRHSRNGDNNHWRRRCSAGDACFIHQSHSSYKLARDASFFYEMEICSQCRPRGSGLRCIIRKNLTTWKVNSADNNF